MPAYKDKQRNTWYVKFNIMDTDGTRRQKLKRGFPTKREALAYEKSFKPSIDPKLTFERLYDIYMEDMSHRLKQSTLLSKEHIFRNHILPYFRSRKVAEITPADIRVWQNTYLSKDYKSTYLSTINTQLTSILHYAQRFYDLPSNPCSLAGSMGSVRAPEMDYWTHEEFQQFIAAFADKPKARLAFLILYWTGVREGELLALNYEDIHLDTKEIHVTKTYHRHKGEDYITPPKTPRSNRRIPIPDFLCEEVETYMSLSQPSSMSQRIFVNTKDFLAYELRYGCEHSGVKKIRIHDIRHSHVSLLINLGFTPVVISQRVGHNNVSTTLNIYSHMFPHQQEALVAALEQLQH